MNLEQLKYFIDVCETGNMTQSAKKFYISPQGLNKSLRSLQKELDVDLLIFQQRKTEMTEEGRLYYTQIKDLVRQLEQINDDIRRNSDKTLSVAISSNTYAMVQGLLEQFERTEPEVRVILSEYSDKIVEEKLLRQEVDAAFITGPIFTSELQNVRLFEAYNELCVPRGHRLASHSFVTFHDLVNEPFLTLNESYKIYDCYNVHMRMANAAPRIVYCGCDLEAIRRLVEEGRGLAISNPQFPIESEKIVKIPMRNKNPWQLSVAIPLRPQSRIAERFFQIVQKAALPLNKKLPLSSAIAPASFPASGDQIQGE